MRLNNLTQISNPTSCQVLRGQIPSIKRTIQFYAWVKMQLSSKPEVLQHFFWKKKDGELSQA